MVVGHIVRRNGVFRRFRAFKQLDLVPSRLMVGTRFRPTTDKNIPDV